MRRWSIPAALMLLAMCAGVASAQGDTPTQVVVTTATLPVLLAPILAAATAVERTLEAAFNFLEATALTLIARLAMGADWLNWAILEVDGANESIKRTSAELRQIVQQERQAQASTVMAADIAARKTQLLAQLDEAEAWLRDSQRRIQDSLKSPNYTRLKQVMALICGVIFGSLLTVIGRMDILQMLGLVQTGSPLGYLLTGLIVGTGAGPVHSLIGILQQTVGAIDQTRALLSGKALRDAAKAVATATGTVPVEEEQSREVGAAPGPDGAGIGRAPSDGTLSPRVTRTLRKLVD